MTGEAFDFRCDHGKSFARLAGSRELAAKRAEEIRPRAVEVVFQRLRDELSRGRLEGAEEHLSWLDEWAPAAHETLEGGRLVAVEKGDLEAELEVVRRLVVGSDSSTSLREETLRSLRRREGELEAKIGDVRLGLEKLEALAGEFPNEPDVTEAATVIVVADRPTGERGSGC